jgi:hypothetical protein
MVGAAFAVFGLWSACIVVLGARRRMRSSDRLAFG